MKTVLITGIFVALLSACSSNKPIIDSSPLNSSPVALCSGGISSGVTAAIEAKYTKPDISGKVSADFAAFVKGQFDANGASEAKYKLFLECVENQAAAIRARDASAVCTNRCAASFTECKDNIIREYDRCLNGGQARCMVQCATVFNLSKAQCDKNCERNKQTNIYQWEQTGQCTTSSTQCLAKRSTCEAACG